MWAVRKNFVKTVPVQRKSYINGVNQVRTGFTHLGTVYGPPRIKISTAEKIFHGLAFTFSLLVVPIFVLANLEHYKHKDGEEGDVPE